MTPVLTDIIDTCAICGEVCQGSDLVYLDEEESALLGLVGERLVCRECCDAEE